MTTNQKRVGPGSVNAAALVPLRARPNSKLPIQPKQLRRLQLLWRRWTGRLALSRERDRELRHYFIWIITEHQCPETRALSTAQAARVIDWLRRRVRESETRENYFAGTAGRKGFPERRTLPPNGSSWRALWRCAEALGMDRAELDYFIRRHYGSRGLRRIVDLRSMADLNRVLWGLKAALRHRTKSADCFGSRRHAA